MELVFIAIAYALPFVVAIALAAAVVGSGLAVAARPELTKYLFLLVMYWASEITYGQVVEGGGSIYSRGAGLLVFPAMVWAIVLALSWFAFLRRFSGQQLDGQAFAIHRWFAVWAVLFVLHVCVALALGVPFRDVVRPSGFSNVVLIWLFMLLLLSTLRGDADLKLLLRFLLVMGLARAMFGLVRWAAFDGDPANAYANRHGLSLKLTFFDVYDSLICFLAVAVAALKLFGRDGNRHDRPLWQVALLWAAMVLPVACIMLSFRRTALIGLVLAGIVVLFYLTRQARVGLVLLAMPVVLAGAAYAAWKRLSQTRLAGGLSDFLFDVTSRQVGADTPRLIELKLAWASFLESPIFGIGAWGGYKGWRLVSWQLYEGGEGTYLHSGILHIGLKTGVIGLVLFGGVVLSFVLFWRSIQSRLTGDRLVLAVAGVAGALFIVPDFLIGTSLTKYRSALFIGLCFALPYAAWFAQRGLQLAPIPRTAAAVPPWRRGAAQPSASSPV